MSKRNYIEDAELKAALQILLEDYAIQMDKKRPEEYHICVLPSEKLSIQNPIMQEIGYQRKRSFANKGAGGKGQLDLDEFDGPGGYDQLAVARTEGDMCEIIGGYRFRIHTTAETLSQLDMGRLFTMNNLCKYVPAIELGRSWVKEEYQSDKITFPHLGCGLGVLRTMFFNEYRPEEKRAKFWFGKVTNPADVNHLLLEFLSVKHPDKLGLMQPKDAFEYVKDLEFDMKNAEYEKAYRKVKPYMPEIWPIYLRMAPKEHIYTCGTSKNDAFDACELKENVEEWEGISETSLAIQVGKEESGMTKMFVTPVEHLVLQKPKLMNWHL